MKLILIDSVKLVLGLVVLLSAPILGFVYCGGPIGVISGFSTDVILSVLFLLSTHLEIN